MRSLVTDLSSFWSKAGFADLPEEVVSKVKDHILDTLAVAIYGSQTAEAQVVCDALSKYQSTDQGSTVWGKGIRLEPAHAALINGTSAHARDFDDGGGPGHAGSTVIPAALALAELEGTTGKEFITAVVAGYDIGYRSLQALGGFASQSDKGWHTSGTMGSLAAAAAGAKILGLQSTSFANALGIAGSFTGGVWAFKADGSQTKRIHPGKAGETGVDASLLAEAGMTGPKHLFEAPWGGLVSTYNHGEDHTEQARYELGTDFNVHSSYLKPYACCRGAHSTVDVLLGLLQSRPLAAEDIEAINVYAGETAMNMLSVDDIETTFDAQFSLPYAISLAINGGSLGLDEYEPVRNRQPEMQTMMAKISMITEPSIELEDGPRLEFVLASGEQFTLEAGNPTTAKGASENPMSHEEVVAKAKSLLDPINAELAQELISAIDNLDHASDVSDLLSVLHTLEPVEAKL